MLPDEVSIEMDLFNNKVGIELQKQHKDADEQQLQMLIKQAVLAGRMRVVKKNRSGTSLDETAKEIPKKEAEIPSEIESNDVKSYKNLLSPKSMPSINWKFILFLII